MQLFALQARAMEGTRPSIVTRTLSTKTPNGRPRGDPCIRVLPYHHCLTSFWDFLNCSSNPQACTCPWNGSEVLSENRYIWHIVA